MSLTDAKGNTTAFEYDDFTRVKTRHLPGRRFRDLHLRSGWADSTTKVDRKNVTTTYAYDALRPAHRQDLLGQHPGRDLHL